MLSAYLSETEWRGELFKQKTKYSERDAKFAGKMKRIAFIVQLPKRVSPAQRFRCELWEPILEANGILVDTFPFLGKSTYRILYKEGFYFKKITGVIIGFLKRFLLLFVLRKYDFILLQREFAPVGPPVFEWIAIKILRVKVIYDFDDAIWIPNTSKENNIANRFKCFWKVKYICRWAYKVVGGNDYLCSFAKQFNNNVIKIPTCVDVKQFRNDPDNNALRPLSIGWTGSHSTLKYLDIIVPVINSLQKENDFKFIVIADKDPHLPLYHYEFIKWNILTELRDLSRIDIGIMPLEADAWSEGKCGFKLIQYFAGGIPAVASPVGVNKIIVEENINGFLCSADHEWECALKKLLADPLLRKRMGIAGRRKVEEQFSIESQSEKFMKLFT